MKTRKILGIIILALVLTFVLGAVTFAATVNVSTEAELRAALASDKLSTDPANPTKVVLTKDIELTQGKIHMEGTSEAPLYVEISGDYSIINNQTVYLDALHQGYNNLYNNEGLIEYFWTNVVLKDVTIDVNYGSKIGETNGFAVGLYGGNADLTLKGDATIKNGGGDWPDFSAATALIYFGGTCTMEDNSLITGATHVDSTSSAKIGSPIIWFRKGDIASNFIMNGGEISGNNNAKWGVICVQDGTEKFELNKGVIHNNTWVDTKGVIANYAGLSYDIGEDMQIAYTSGEVLEIIPTEPDTPTDPDTPVEPDLATGMAGVWSVRPDGSKRLYLVAGIDSLNYKSVGFEVSVDGGTPMEISTKTVYTSINVTENGVAKTKTPADLGETNNYIFGKGFGYPANRVGTSIKVKAFAMTFEGTKLYSKEITIELK